MRNVKFIFIFLAELLMGLINHCSTKKNKKITEWGRENKADQKGSRGSLLFLFKSETID